MGAAEMSVRFFNDAMVRIIWNDADSKWMFSAVDIVAAVTGSNDPRKYWNALKSRNPELSTFCRQLRMVSSDGKKYLTDAVDDYGSAEIISAIPNKSKSMFKDIGKNMTIADRSGYAEREHLISGNTVTDRQKNDEPWSEINYLPG